MKRGKIIAEFCDTFADEKYIFDISIKRRRKRKMLKKVFFFIFILRLQKKKILFKFSPHLLYLESVANIRLYHPIPHSSLLSLFLIFFYKCTYTYYIDAINFIMILQKK